MEILFTEQIEYTQKSRVVLTPQATTSLGERFQALTGELRTILDAGGF
jgi:hypothetical protein